MTVEPPSRGYFVPLIGGPGTSSTEGKVSLKRVISRKESHTAAVPKDLTKRALS